MLFDPNTSQPSSDNDSDGEFEHPLDAEVNPQASDDYFIESKGLDRDDIERRSDD